MKRTTLTLLVDGPSLIYRAYFALPDSIGADDGTPVNAAYGFLSMLERLLTDLRPSQLAVGMDADWRPQWRVDLVDSYKSHRVAAAEDEVGEEVERQIDLIGNLLRMARIAVVGAPGCEAEDVLATLVPRIRGPIAIVSGDRDLYQLVRDPNVWVLYPVKGVSELRRVDEADISARYGIPGRAYADFAVLRGDPSDGLPGVPGIGEKLAAQLVAKYGSLEGVLEASRGAPSGPLAKVAKAEDYVRRAEQVVRMKGNCRVGKVDLAMGAKPPSPRLRSRAKSLGLSGPVDRLLAVLGGTSPTR